MEPENTNCKTCDMRMHCITASKTICDEEYEQMQQEQMEHEQRISEQEYEERKRYEEEYYRNKEYK